jgi:4-amino-4-deoxy-L-arabinose transferase-like glycosyltransferase
MPKYITIYYYLFLSVLLFIILWGFWQYPISLFDEALYANNALEMSHTNNFFVLTLDYKPDLYNTKPPLAIWLMAASIKLFGANEWAIRFPSILAFILAVVSPARHNIHVRGGSSCCYKIIIAL